MKSFRLQISKWQQRDVLSWLVRSTIFSIIMLGIILVAGPQEGSPLFWCLMVIFLFALGAMTTERDVQARSSSDSPDAVPETDAEPETPDPAPPEDE